MATPAVVPAALWCKSHYCFLEGASSPAELVATAAELGLSALALTDRDGVYGAPAAYLATRGLATAPRLITGSEVTLDDGTTLVLLAMTHDGYRNLCRLVTAGRLRCAKGESRVGWDEVCNRAEGLIALWGGARSRLAQAGSSGLPALVGRLREAFGDRLYALLARHEHADEVASEARLRRRAARAGLPLVAGVEVLYHHRDRRALQDTLTCIRHRTTLREAGRLLRPNDAHHLPSPAGLATLFADLPDAVARTAEVAGRCVFSLAQLRYRYPTEQLPRGMSTGAWLDTLTERGARQRFGARVPPAVAARIAQELQLIHELDYDGYFLTMWEIVRFCREQDILCQGRGSAANSVVCYCLGITAVNPTEVDLLFERFISRERAEPPDIDLDIEHDRREEVIQHVYERYGRHRAAMVANVIRFRPRSAIREVGAVLGLPAVQLDRLAKFAARGGGALDAAALTRAGLDAATPAHQHLVRLVAEVQDVPRHLGIHPGGFLLGHEPVSDLVPIENATMAGRTVIQWDKRDVEALGLFKVDLLGLGALNHLHRCFDLLRRHRGQAYTLATIPRRDQATFAMIQRADTVGVFQIESRAQMAMLPRLRPETYYDLVIQVAIIRPGPITGGMVHPYIARRHGREAVTYPHPSLEPVLSKTLGVPLFQEQVMRLAMVAADYTPGEADQLRRDMASWRRHGPIEQHHDRLVSRMVGKGISAEFAERVFDQIRGFGEYGFPESHAASFALIAYATAWLKCHYPAEFACGLLNALPMGFYMPGTIVEDARRHGVEVRPLDILRSSWECTLEERDDGAGMGLRFVKGLSVAEADRLLTARAERAFISLDDLARRTNLPHDALLHLAQAGALEPLVGERRQALWQVHALTRRRRPEQLELPLADRVPAPPLAPLTDHEVITWDWDCSQHSPRGHLLEPLREDLRAQGLPTAVEVAGLPHGARAHYAGVVICRQRPATASGVTFMTLEDETGFVNLVLWQRVYEQWRLLARTRSFLGVTGKIQSEDSVVHLVVESLWVPRLPRSPAVVGSRDFQ